MIQHRFRAAERLHLMTPNTYEFQFMKRPVHMSNFSFLARADHDVRVALSASPRVNPEMYEVVLGGLLSAESWISQGPEGNKSLFSLSLFVFVFLIRGRFDN